MGALEMALFVLVHLCILHVCGCQGGQNRAFHLWELKLQAVVGCSTWVLETERESSRRPTSVFIH